VAEEDWETKMRAHGYVKLLSIATICVLFGCAHSPSSPAEKSSQEPSVPRPSWVTRGSGLRIANADTGEKRGFYGVGLASGIRNAATARTTADNRAKVEVRKRVDTLAASLAKAYMATVRVSDGPVYDPHITETLVDPVADLRQKAGEAVEILAHWTAPDDGTVYAEGGLTLDAFIDTVSLAKGVSEPRRVFIARNAEEAFMEMYRLESQNRGQVVP
jgi:hypothetical protein